MQTRLQKYLELENTLNQERRTFAKRLDQVEKALQAERAAKSELQRRTQKLLQAVQRTADQGGEDCDEDEFSDYDEFVA